MKAICFGIVSIKGFFPPNNAAVCPASSSIALFPTPDTAWYNFVQYDDESDGVGLNSRLWHIFEPGREVFIVLNQSWNTMDDRFVPERTGLALKFGYTLRF